MFSLVFSSEMRSHESWTSLSGEDRQEITDKINHYVFCLLSSQECAALSEVNQACYQANVHFQLKPYHWLKEKIRFPSVIYSLPSTIEEAKELGNPQNEIDALECRLDAARKEVPKKIYITGPDGNRCVEQLGKMLGKGQYKQAIELSQGRALIIPLLGNIPARSFLKHCWPRMVKEEVKMSNILTQVGLLSPCSQEVKLSFFKNSKEKTLPAYVHESFEHLAQAKNCFILNMSSISSSTWREGDYLFSSNEARFNEKNWDSVLDSFLTDVAKICLYQIPVRLGSNNLAVIKTMENHSPCPYEIRHFGFDFCSKPGYELHFEGIEMKPTKLPSREELNKVLSHFLFMFMQVELEGTWHRWRDMSDRLVKRYEETLFERAKQLFNEISQSQS